ncbi:YncE family protein [Dyadobacter sp.]|uniref:YncE family protein n=1 Tax=Dyadobacter sp. TaxID=1914288 RepID=UPI003F6E465D
MKQRLSRVLFFIACTVTVWSCNQSDPEPKGDFARGVFVINEGNFSQNNGAISFFTRENTNAEVDIYAKANGTALKGGVQGYAAAGEQGIILVDNMNAGMDKIEFVNAYTFQKQGTIDSPEIDNPREVVISGNRAYVSCWGTNADYNYTTGYIAVIDLNTKKVTKKIAIADGPENLVFTTGKLFVGTTSNTGGKILYVVDTNTETVTKTINLEGTPTPIGIDANGKLWAGAGIKAVKIDPASYAVETTLPIGTDAKKSAGNFALTNDLKSIVFTLSYYDANFVLHGETYKFGIGDTQINLATPLIRRVFTGLAIDPSQGLIYAGVTPSYAQAGYAVRYRADGSLVDSVKVNVAPTGFFFQ